MQQRLHYVQNHSTSPVGCIDSSYLRQRSDSNCTEAVSVACQSTFCQDKWCKTRWLHANTTNSLFAILTAFNSLLLKSVSWLVFNGTVSTNRLLLVITLHEYEIYHVGPGEQDKHIIKQWNNTLNKENHFKKFFGLGFVETIPLPWFFLRGVFLAITWQVLTNGNNQETEHIQTQTNNTKSGSNKWHTEEKILRERQSEPGLVTFYDIQPGNGADLFLQPRNPHGAFFLTAEGRDHVMGPIFSLPINIHIIWCTATKFYVTTYVRWEGLELVDHILHPWRSRWDLRDQCIAMAQPLSKVSVL